MPRLRRDVGVHPESALVRIRLYAGQGPRATSRRGRSGTGGELLGQVARKHGEAGSQGYGPRVVRWPGVVQAVFAALDPEGFARRRAREGDPFLLRLPGVGETLVSGSPEGARELFTADPAIFDTVPANPLEGLLGPGSLLVKSGAAHARKRKRAPSTLWALDTAPSIVPPALPRRLPVAPARECNVWQHDARVPQHVTAS